MQKILRRVATAERVAVKRQRARDLTKFKKEKKESSKERLQVNNAAKQDIERAKQAVRDDWNLGSLSPRIDYGEWAGAHGAIGEVRFSFNGKLSLAQRNRRCQWAGGAYNLNLAIGDRVVILDGPDKGQIGKISDIDEDKAEVKVEDLNRSNIRMIPHIREMKDPAAINMEVPLPISSIRLVHPVNDPNTGVTRDVIINQLVHSDMIYDRLSGKRRWSRIVPGLNISIPWPPKEDKDIPDHEADTLRIDVEEKTFVPTLLRPPMPETVIDELRNRYSRFRTRHEPEYIARLEAEEQAKEARKQLMESMRTPLQEFHRVERANKKRKGKPRLSVEMLEKIGGVIAKNRERSLQAAGVSDLSSSPSLGLTPPLSAEVDILPSTTTIESTSDTPAP